MKRTILAPGHELLSYRIHEVTPYINWIYFFHAWGFQPRFAAIANIHGCDSCRALWLTTFPEEERTKASEAMQLFKEANRMLDRLDETISIHCIFRLCQANADGDNLLIEGTTFPLLRQQTPQPDGGPFLCLSDFVRPLSSGTPDIVGLFASTISEEAPPRRWRWRPDCPRPADHSPGGAPDGDTPPPGCPNRRRCTRCRPCPPS